MMLSLANFSWEFYLLSEFLLQNCGEEIAVEIIFEFYFDDWPNTCIHMWRMSDIEFHTFHTTQS